MRVFWWFVALFRRDRSEYLPLSNERRRMNIRHEMQVVATVLVVLGNIVWGTYMHAQVKSDYPKLTPAQAAEILRNSPGLSNRTNVVICTDCDGPHVASTGSKEASLGPWDFPPPSPRRRLDGTLIDTRPPESFWAPRVYVRRR